MNNWYWFAAAHEALNDDARNHESAHMTEIWLPVSGYESLYEVSNYGNVRSLDRSVNARGGSTATRKGRILVPTEGGNGYLRVCLARGRAKEYRSIHRLVAFAFLQARTGANFVNHKDLNKTNNRADNLEWVTCSENNKHAHDAGAFAEGNNLASKNPKVARKLSASAVEQIRELAQSGITQTSIAKQFGISPSMVSYLKNRKTWREPSEGRIPK